MRFNHLLTGLLLYFFLVFLGTGCAQNQIEDEFISEATPTFESLIESSLTTTVEKKKQTSPPQSDPKDLTIRKTTLRSSSPDSTQVIGLVQNNTPNTISDVQVNVQIHDEQDQLLYSDTTGTLKANIPPGQDSPFVMEFTLHLRVGLGLTASVTDYEIGETEKPDLQIRKEFLNINKNGDIYLTGELYNSSLDPMLIQELTAIFLGKEGEPIAASSDFSSIQYLDPGEYGPFRLSTPSALSPDGTIVDFQIFPNTIIVPPKVIFDLQLISNPTTYLDGNNSYHLVGEIRNQSEHTLWVSLAAGVYDDEGYMIDASTTTIPIPLSPGEKLPYGFADWGSMNSESRVRDQAKHYSVQWDPAKTQISQYDYVNLPTQQNQYLNNQVEATFTGEIINNTGRTVNIVTAMVNLYDINTGMIASTTSQTIEGILPDSENTQYEIILNTGGNFDINSYNVEIIVKGQLIDE